MQYEFSLDEARFIAVLLHLIGVLSLKAQSSDSIQTLQLHRTFKKGLYTPATLIVAGVFASSSFRGAIKNEVAEERDEHLGNFHTHIDNYLQYSPIAFAYALDAAGIRSRTDIADRTVILLKGELVMLAAVTLLKSSTHQLRPDGSSYNSFPSGHTAQAFAAATFLSEEYKDRYKWMPYTAYGIASSVGILRMANNRHYISDVLVGAGLGILSMKAAYWTHQYHWGKMKRAATGFNPRLP